MLTPSGERMVEAARRALADISDAAASVRRIGTGEAGSLRIGTTGQVTERGRALFRRFSDVHCDFALLFEEGVPTEICRSVSAGALDVYFGIDVLVSSELETLALWRETISLVVPETHPLAERDSVGVGDFADETLVVVGSPGTDYSNLIRQQFGRPIRFRVAAGTFQNTLLDALFGQGVVVAPSGNTEELPSGLSERILRAKLGPGARHDLHQTHRALGADGEWVTRALGAYDGTNPVFGNARSA